MASRRCTPCGRRSRCRCPSAYRSLSRRRLCDRLRKPLPQWRCRSPKSCSRSCRASPAGTECRPARRCSTNPRRTRCLLVRIRPNSRTRRPIHNGCGPRCRCRESGCTGVLLRSKRERAVALRVHAVQTEQVNVRPKRQVTRCPRNHRERAGFSSPSTVTVTT